MLCPTAPGHPGDKVGDSLLIVPLNLPCTRPLLHGADKPKIQHSLLMTLILVIDQMVNSLDILWIVNDISPPAGSWTDPESEDQQVVES